MRYRYRTRKARIFIEVLEETILTRFDNKYGPWLISISENQEEYEKDLLDLLELCPTKSARKWIRKMTWEKITSERNEK